MESYHSFYLRLFMAGQVAVLVLTTRNAELIGQTGVSAIGIGSRRPSTLAHPRFEVENYCRVLLRGGSSRLLTAILLSLWAVSIGYKISAGLQCQRHSYGGYIRRSPTAHGDPFPTRTQIPPTQLGWRQRRRQAIGDSV
ncbi:hypothetical protein FOTG_17477, partial [Fusarium oxysporum f. sp. vasinfectum 25433]